MKIETSRFGKIAIDKSLVIHFPDGLPGFLEQKDFVILEHKTGSPFCWLQSLTHPDLAFVITDPHVAYPSYLSDLSAEDRYHLHQEENEEDIFIFTLVTIPPGKPKEATVNLLGPIVINTGSGTGKQVILSHSGYNHRHPLILS
ncbi:MAG: flagellar assembly protein FliW [Deltaproteobacteria bacterium]|nr:flagellar assembly protein FliW [Deltaproteobacteria bacterium]